MTESKFRQMVIHVMTMCLCWWQKYVDTQVDEQRDRVRERERERERERDKH